MISYDEAIKIIFEQRASFPVVERSLCDSMGHVCAESIQALETIPQFNNSAMDGYVLKSSETTSASVQSPKSFQVVGTIAAGSEINLEDKVRETFVSWRIMTGAPVPDAFDAVLRIEDAMPPQHSSDGELRIDRPLSVGEHVRKSGEDFNKGDTILSYGDPVEPKHIMALATQGISKLKVFDKPKVVVISTGEELVTYTQKELNPGQIRNSTQPFLVAALSQMGAHVKSVHLLRDDAKKFIEKVSNVLMSDSPDIVITTGAISMGQFDFIPQAIREMGGNILFHKAEIRPGKPILFSRLNKRTVLFGLPGNPISSAVGLRFFVEPYLRRQLNQSSEIPVSAILENTTQKKLELRCFYKAKVYSTRQGHLKVLILDGQPSFMVHSLLQANAWAVLPEGKNEYHEGEVVDVIPLHASRGGFEVRGES